MWVQFVIPRTESNDGWVNIKDGTVITARVESVSNNGDGPVIGLARFLPPLTVTGMSEFVSAYLYDSTLQLTCSRSKHKIKVHSIRFLSELGASQLTG